MDIRAGTRSDFPGIRDVADRSLAASYADVIDADARKQAIESWYGTEDGPPTPLEEEVDDERTVMLVAENGDGIVGFAQAYRSGDVGRIEWIHVHPEHRDAGIGDDLLARVESVLVDAGAKRIEARVIEANEEGRAFYEEHGYELHDSRDVRIGDDDVAELTLVATTETVPAGTERQGTDEGRVVVIATDESEHGTKGPFHPTYVDEAREQRLGWHCGACDSLNVNMGTMGEIVCGNCGNQRRPRRWDAAYGG
ncbi:GNAT family N-acetyltransferase [Halolamina litorea]|uniref:GNAT family N-acetyltransferase n=1 Tax=Halolamina litorea TaxID=1515593 RepID=A0ABD6BPZ1_9EURY|nr:GNAT family N-acetyltransferase [Halolamina litorea]